MARDDRMTNSARQKPSRLRSPRSPAGKPANLDPNPAVVVNGRAAVRLRAGHVWVYRSDLVEAHAPPGSLVQVLDEGRNLLGTALYSNSSQIALRMIANHPVAPGAPFLALIQERLRAALEYRKRMVRDTNAYRVVFSEADSLPGLILDLYNDMVSFQVVTQAFDQPAIKDLVIGWIREELVPAAIVERVDQRIRQLEELPELQTRVVYSMEPEAPRVSTTFSMNGVRFHYDALGGQ
jgi:23S rRNA (cytosine1962-C5)-methyltransferase